MGRALWQRRVDTAYGPAVFDAQPARDTLAEAEAALRAGDASRAEATYLRTLGKLGPFSDPAWKSDRATDERTRSQCHARLAALAFDQRDYDRSLRQTAAAAAARHEAIACDSCTDDDVRFMITALVHAATVHERVGSLGEALRSCRVALEFADYADAHDDQTRDLRTRRSIASARRAATRLLDELAQRPDAPGESVDGDSAGLDEGLALRDVDLAPLYASPPVEITAVDLAELSDGSRAERGPEPSAVPSPDLGPVDLNDLGDDIDLHLATEIEPVDLGDLGDLSDDGPSGPRPELEPVDLADIHPEVVIDLTESEPVLDLTADRPDEIDKIDEDHELDEDEPVDRRFERHPDLHRARQAARQIERELAAGHDPRVDEPADEHDTQVDRRATGRLVEPAATLLTQARAQAMTARFLLAQGDEAAAIHAHRSVRTATRARPWAKHDADVTAEVALTMVDALVTRSDVLAAAGNEEVSQTDLRRARTVADHLWRACPTPSTAIAAVLVSVRSAARGWNRDDKAETAAHLEQATMIIVDADTLGVELPEEVVTFEPPAEATCERDALLAFGDQLIEALQTLHARELDPAVVG